MTNSDRSSMKWKTFEIRGTNKYGFHLKIHRRPERVFSWSVEWFHGLQCEMEFRRLVDAKRFAERVGSHLLRPIT